MKSKLLHSLLAIICIIGLSSCGLEDLFHNDKLQEFSGDRLQIRINSVQWEAVDLERCKVEIAQMGEDLVLVSLQSILQDDPSVSLVCKTSNTQGTNYTFDGKHKFAQYKIELHGIVKNNRLDLRIEYVADYDVTGKWMLAEQDGAFMDLSVNVPDIRIEVQIPDDANFFGEPLPTNELNTLLAYSGMIVGAVEFSESGYLNLSLAPELIKDSGVQSSDIQGIAQYYTNGQLYIYARTSILYELLQLAVKSAQPVPPEPPFHQLALNYNLIGERLCIYLDKELLLNYFDHIANFLNNLTDEQLLTMISYMGLNTADFESIKEELGMALFVVIELRSIFKHEDAHFRGEINLIPWTPGTRPWTGLIA